MDRSHRHHADGVRSHVHMIGNLKMYVGAEFQRLRRIPAEVALSSHPSHRCPLPDLPSQLLVAFGLHIQSAYALTRINQSPAGQLQVTT